MRLLSRKSAEAGSLVRASFISSSWGLIPVPGDDAPHRTRCSTCLGRLSGRRHILPHERGSLFLIGVEQALLGPLPANKAQPMQPAQATASAQFQMGVVPHELLHAAPGPVGK